MQLERYRHGTITTVGQQIPPLVVGAAAVGTIASTMILRLFLSRRRPRRDVTSPQGPRLLYTVTSTTVAVFEE